MKRRGRYQGAWRAGVFVIAAVLAACASSSSEPGGTQAPEVKTPPPTTPTTPGSTPTAAPVTKNIGNEGGTLVNDHGTGVEIPAGALPADVQISVTAAPGATPPSNTESLGTPTVFGPNGVQFAKPVTVVVAFDPAKLPPGTDASKIVVYTAPDGTTDYKPLATVVRDATHVAAETTHFCVMVPVVPPAGACIPRSCASLPDACGDQDDGCGGTIKCGPCPTNPPNPPPEQDAGLNPPADAGTTGPGGSPDAGSHVPDGGQCEPVLCGFWGPGACGSLPNQCGGELDCGPCGGGPDGGTGPGPADAGPGGSDGGVCMPLRCDLHYKDQCGSFPDGCNGVIECTECTVPTPDAGPPPPPFDAGPPPPPFDAGPPPPPFDAGPGCEPKMCPPTYCGLWDDGCGRVYECSNCAVTDAAPPPMDASPPPPPHDAGGACRGCGPGMCGPHDDGCGHVLQCTDCGPQPEAGACFPQSCPPMFCGSVPDGCGGMLTCTQCAGSDAGACFPSVHCTPGMCGPFDDGCGGVLECHDCPPPPPGKP